MVELKERSEEMDPTERVGFGLFSGVNWRRVGGGEWLVSGGRHSQLSRPGVFAPVGPAYSFESTVFDWTPVNILSWREIHQSGPYCFSAHYFFKTSELRSGSYDGREESQSSPGYLGP